MRRRSAATAILLVASLGLAACSGGDLVAQSAAQLAERSPNLDFERVEEVLSEVSKALAAGDETLDANRFAGRVIGGAARVRAAQYAYARASGETLPALDLTAQNLAVTNSSEWPRAILNIRQAAPSDLPVVEMLVQEDARSDYALAAWCRMLGGTSVTVPSIEEGSAFVSKDSTGFTMTPGEAVRAYVDMLNASQSSNEKFASDEFTAHYLETVKTLSANLEKAGIVTANAEISELPISGVVLQDGSALVAANFTYTLTYTRTIAGSTMRLGGQTATLNAGDEDAVKGSAVATYVATVLIDIPSAVQGGVARIVGADRVLESVVMDDSSNPDNH